jgi:hypothetical protein
MAAFTSRFSITVMFSLAAIAVTASVIPVADAFSQRGSGRIDGELAYRGSGRFDHNQGAHRLLAYRGSGRLSQGLELAYRGSERGIQNS